MTNSALWSQNSTFKKKVHVEMGKQFFVPTSVYLIILHHILHDPAPNIICITLCKYILLNVIGTHCGNGFNSIELTSYIQNKYFTVKLKIFHYEDFRP